MSSLTREAAVGTRRDGATQAVSVVVSERPDEVRGALGVDGHTGRVVLEAGSRHSLHVLVSAVLEERSPPASDIATLDLGPLIQDAVLAWSKIWYQVNSL